jgi:hypothetical protein
MVVTGRAPGRYTRNARAMIEHEVTPEAGIPPSDGTAGPVRPAAPGRSQHRVDVVERHPEWIVRPGRGLPLPASLADSEPARCARAAHRTALGTSFLRDEATASGPGPGRPCSVAGTGPEDGEPRSDTIPLDIVRAGCHVPAASPARVPSGAPPLPTTTADARVRSPVPVGSPADDPSVALGRMTVLSVRRVRADATVRFPIDFSTMPPPPAASHPARSGVLPDPADPARDGQVALAGAADGGREVTGPSMPAGHPAEQTEPATALLEGAHGRRFDLDDYFAPDQYFD